MARLFEQRHYIAIAESIKGGLRGSNMSDQDRLIYKTAALTMHDVVDRLVDMFKADSGKFDEVKFRRACGYEIEEG